ncbi:hypothetical protein [Frondihabitans cladoniiphilus]|uniref:Uncharacterized protein n=1 Tax=Frondihabitans cladoniiphilus TaxID=715785 RepID=A0ABP8W9L5_9MICO
MPLTFARARTFWSRPGPDAPSWRRLQNTPLTFAETCFFWSRPGPDAPSWRRLQNTPLTFAQARTFWSRHAVARRAPTRGTLCIPRHGAPRASRAGSEYH